MDAAGGVLIGRVLHFTCFSLNLIVEFGTGKTGAGTSDHSVSFHIYRVS